MTPMELSMLLFAISGWCFVFYFREVLKEERIKIKNLEHKLDLSEHLGRREKK